MSDADVTGNPIARLLSSSKAIVILIVIGLTFAALYLGKASWDESAGLLKWVLGPWLVAVGVEDAAKHVGRGMTSKRGSSSASVEVNLPSARPPPPDVEVPIVVAVTQDERITSPGTDGR